LKPLLLEEYACFSYLDFPVLPLIAPPLAVINLVAVGPEGFSVQDTLFCHIRLFLSGVCPLRYLRRHLAFLLPFKPLPLATPFSPEIDSARPRTFPPRLPFLLGFFFSFQGPLMHGILRHCAYSRPFLPRCFFSG